MGRARERVPADSTAAMKAADPKTAHPYLSADLAAEHPALYRNLFRAYQGVREDERAYELFLNRTLYPPGRERPLQSSSIEAAYYLNEASRYLDALLDLLPRRRRARLRALQRVHECHEMRNLLAMVFDPRARRRAFEAQRKIYLAKLFFDVAHTWEVQRGDVHRQFLSDVIAQQLLSRTVAERDVDIAFNIAADGLGIDYRLGRPLPEQEAWRFHLRELRLSRRGRAVRVRVYFYSCRSKREVLPYRYVRGQWVHELRPVEKWTRLSLRRDASIISKMLRGGTSDPGAVPDIVGVMFIVEDVTEVEHLKQALFDILGGALRVRRVLDTLVREEDREQLNPYSGAGYKVYKAEMDLLYQDAGDDSEPYSYRAEIQLYTLESYLRTIHTRHYANHQLMKRRQFVGGLVPLLFPVEIYGNASATAR